MGGSTLRKDAHRKMLYCKKSKIKQNYVSYITIYTCIHAEKSLEGYMPDSRQWLPPWKNLRFGVGLFVTIFFLTKIRYLCFLCEI